MTAHNSHPDIVKRLRRASGHLDRVTKMIGEESPCLAIAQHLQAVSGALSSAKTILVQTHTENCLTGAFQGKASANLPMKIQEFKEIAKYL